MSDKIKKHVQDFWDSSPCGTYLIKHKEGTKEYYEAIADYRYNKPPYEYSFIPSLAGFNKFRGKKVLEVGCGIGTDISQFAKNGATVTGIDLTPNGIKLAKRRFDVMELGGGFAVTDAENLPFQDNSFDYVYSFGVLHHTPNTEKAIEEVRRVLNPGGSVNITLYHKMSLQHFVFIFRKWKNSELWGLSNEEVVNRLSEVHRESEEIINPLTKMYTKDGAKKFFVNFKNVRTKVNYVRIPFLKKFIPQSILNAVGKKIGWYLTIKAEK